MWLTLAAIVPAQPPACPDAPAATSTPVLLPSSSVPTRAARTRGRVPSPESGLLTVRQTADRLGVAPSTFYKRLKDGSFQRAGLKEAKRVTGKRLFIAASVNVALGLAGPRWEHRS